jgi:hypothetical protein
VRLPTVAVVSGQWHREESDIDELWCWQVGDVWITRVQELEALGMRFIVPQATIDNLAGIPWLTPFLAVNGDAMGSVPALLLEVADQWKAWERRPTLAPTLLREV